MIDACSSSHATATSLPNLASTSSYRFTLRACSAAKSAYTLSRVASQSAQASAEPVTSMPAAFAAARVQGNRSQLDARAGLLRASLGHRSCKRTRADKQ